MEFVTTSHNHAEIILEHDPEFAIVWPELKAIITGITEKEVAELFSKQMQHKSGKSLSVTINKIFREKLTQHGWIKEPFIFQEPHLRTKKTWRLDFAKPGTIAIEVAFNNGGSVAWNLTKLVLASNINLMEKDTVTKVGIIITATHDLIQAGGFDEVVGSYEKYVEYLQPLSYQLSAPILVIGLLPPKTFKVKVYTVPGEKNKRGKVFRLISRNCFLGQWYNSTELTRTK